MVTIHSSRPIEYSGFKPLGEGSSGAVYSALRKDIELKIEQAVAIKILKSQIPVDDWRSEFSLLSRVNSNRCVRVLGWDNLENRLALVLELVQGVTLEKLIRYYNLSEAITEELVCQVFEGLQDISRAGISHGDLSLKNVMVNENGEIKIIDFGLFKGGRGHFTPEFAAPEIFEQEAPTFFSDLYSLGRIQFFIESKSNRNISAATLKMLALRPSDRDFVTSRVNAEVRAWRREQLARLVTELMNVKNVANSKSSLVATIFTSVASVHLKKYIWRAVCGLMLCLNLSTGAATADLRPGYIYIRTTNWAAVQLNGVAKGYSPMDLRVNSNERVQIALITAKGKVSRTLTVSPGQNIVLDDTFLHARRGDKHESQLVK